MTRSDDYDPEMPVFPYPRHAGELPVPGVQLDRLLDGVPSGAPTSPEIDALGGLLAAAAAPAAGHELAGEASVVAVFARERNTGRRPETGTGRRSMLATVLSTKLAAAVAAGAVSLGGVAAAAYAGALPKPIQDFAHQTVGAPSADKGGNAENSDANEHQGSSAEPAGPDATGSAKYGLCTAFADEKAENGKVDTHSIAFQALAKAAGGADKIDAFCAGAIPPGAGSGQTHQPEDPAGDHPTGPPTDASHGQPSGTPPVPEVGNVPTSPPTGH